MWRDIYRFGLNPEVYIDEANLRQLLTNAGFLSGITKVDLSIASSLSNLEVMVNAATASIKKWLDCAEGAKPMLIGELLQATAPFANCLGAWLQGLTAPSVFEDEIHLSVLNVLADDIGGGEAEASRADAFRLIARRAGFPKAAVRPNDLANDQGIVDVLFAFPAILFMMSRRSDAFAPEIAGIDVALRRMGLLPPWRALAEVDGDPSWRRLDLAVPQNADLLGDELAIDRAGRLADGLGQNTVSKSRVIDGISIAMAGLDLLFDELGRRAAVVLDPGRAMARLIQQRAREGAVYHQNFRLEGRSLSDWFGEARHNPDPLVAALARSRLVCAGAPDRSRLLGDLIRPSGRMFRIFNDEDLAIIRRWITSLATARPVHVAKIEALGIKERQQHQASPLARKIGQGNVQIGATPGNVRQAYALLQGRALAPRTRAFALDYCRFRLAIAERSIGMSDRSLPPEWQPGLLREWLLERHERAGTEYEKASSANLPDRDTVIHQTLQLAPLTLIDGAWLQGFTDVIQGSTRVGSRLFQTYWDELGNGEIAINHPKIYRELLSSMGFDMPPTASLAFVNNPLFQDSSFLLPVYWLSLGKLPMTMRPEILGLNLAMELSGVGGSYRSARQFLKLHGFSTQFVDLHNTIDNIATGHTAWAADAIDAHLTEISELVDIEGEWARIRAGFESLAPIVRNESELDYFAHTHCVQQPGPALQHISILVTSDQIADEIPPPLKIALTKGGHNA